MKIGTPVIINDTDRPCTRLIAIVDEVRANGVIHARYLTTGTKSHDCYAIADQVTPVSVFGVVLTVDGALAWTHPQEPSRATYRDKKPRLWQEELPARAIPVRPEVAKLISV